MLFADAKLGYLSSLIRIPRRKIHLQKFKIYVIKKIQGGFAQELICSYEDCPRGP